LKEKRKRIRKERKIMQLRKERRTDMIVLGKDTFKI